MWDFDNTNVSGMIAHDGCRGRVVHNHRARSSRDTLEHGVREVSRVRARARAVGPQLPRQRAIPFTEVVNELLYVPVFFAESQKEVVEHGVVQDGDAGLGQSALVNLSMK